ncbi:BCCT family transporter [Ornithinimicrobium pratense]|uniref:BCCT family transporter n=1 Tax=Ornithinimicrobium pratense TaxID=2593973 RepID=A0A5J6V5Q2_9MICO|nr:BCCT family transporter [Ornithinimicrobium pratense]QFG68342.1 BCCT family transporter [Ornithinimicrobium pratense]
MAASNASDPPTPTTPLPRPTGWSAISRPVFFPASAVILGLLVLTIVLSWAAGDELDQATAQVNSVITDGVGWWYVIAVNIFLIFTIYCAVSRIGLIRLGRDDEEPEFGVLSWFLMLFSAGMGIGLVFFSVAEPLSHYVIPPEAFGDEPESLQAAQDSVGLMMLQWGLHPWGIYAVVGLGLAYMSFRRGRPLAIRWLLEPLLGRQRVEGWIGHTIDTIAIVGTLFGVATSFGFGVSQIIGGLEFLGWAQSSPWLIIGLIAGITAIAVWSVVSGVHKGLKWLSNFNMTITALLAVVVFILGPTVFLLKAFPQNVGNYLGQLPTAMWQTGPFTTDGWEAAWPIFYWGWWTSWAPFVGMFIARISRGRTIREFVLGVILAPTMTSLIWFTIFGDSAILFQREQGGLAIEDPTTGEMTVDSTTTLFAFFEYLPGGMATVLSVVAMVVIVFFFVTSSDSGSLVIDMLASGGSTQTPTLTRVYWTILEGAVAAALLVVGGSVALTALQTLSISTALPFSLILALACLSLLRAFRHEVATMPHYIEVLSQPPRGGAAEQPRPSTGWRPGRQLGGVSATLAGMRPPAPPPGQRPGQDSTSILHYRHLGTAPRVDAETGQVDVQVVQDPLAGEVFETAEFAASQEFLDQGGTPPATEPPEPEAVAEDGPEGGDDDADTTDGQASRREPDVD